MRLRSVILAAALFLGLGGLAHAQINVSSPPGASGVAGVSKVTGTAGQVSAAPTTGNVVVSLPSTITENLTFSGTNAYGTPTSITLTNATGTAANLTAGAVTGLSVTSGKTLTVSNSITLAGTDSTTMTFPSSSKTILANDLSNLSGGLGTGNLTALNANANATGGFGTVGTSGTNVGLLNVSNTFGANQTMGGGTAWIFDGSSSGSFEVASSSTGQPLLTNVPNSAESDALCFNTGSFNIGYATACTASDAGLKTEITALDPSAVLSGLAALHPGTGHWLDAAENKRKGEQLFETAQDVQAAGNANPGSGLANLVFTMSEPIAITLSDGTNKTIDHPLGIDYARGFVYNVAVEQALEGQMTALTARVAKLEAR